MCSLFLLADPFLERVWSNLFHVLSDGRILLDKVIHSVDVHQFQCTLIKIIQVVSTFHHIFGELQHRYPNWINLDPYIIIVLLF